MKKLNFVATINGTRHNFEIIAKSWETRSSWGHEADLWDGDRFICSTRRRYYNRTWECWQYESVCQDLLDQYLDRVEAVLLDAYRLTNDKKRLTPEDKKRALRPVAGLRRRLMDHLQKANKKRW